MARETWTDGRLDEFKENMNHRFDEVDGRFDQVDKRFELVGHRFDRVEGDIREIRGEISQIHLSLQAMNRTMAQGFIGVCGIMITGFVALAGITAF